METITREIGKICIKSLRDIILDLNLTDDDSIALHKLNFEDLVIEHREFYGESMRIPFFLLGVLIREDDKSRTPLNKLSIIKNDEVSRSLKSMSNIEYPPNEIFYRCGWCGNVVDYDGAELNPENRGEKIRLLNKFGDSIKVKAVTGYCCKDKER